MSIKKHTLETANQKIQTLFPDLEFLTFNGARNLSTIRSNKCGHVWEASLSNASSKIGGHICRVCIPRRDIKLNLDMANIKLKSKLPELEYIEYNGSNSMATIRSIKCGHQWNGIPRNIMSKHSGHICRICTPANNSILSLKKANDRLNILFPDKKLSFMEYKGLQIPTTITSSICGHSWLVTLNNITTGNTAADCPICVPSNSGTSKPEKELLSFIKDNYNGWIIENDRLNIPPLELDIVLPDLGLAIEYNGIYWHRDKEDYHINKTNRLIDEIGYQLIHINEDEWLYKQNIVKSRLLSHLGKCEKIYARKCTVKEISFPAEFLEQNHIQGKGNNTSINLGLYFMDELVSVMTFGKPRFNTEYDYELVRFCSKLNTSIIGGASKLFNYFNNTYLGSVISYSDRRWSTGNIYKLLGFEYSHRSNPNYRYYKGNTSLSRYQCQKHLLQDKFPNTYSDNKTEYEIMSEEGYLRMYDCGNDVWIYK